MSGESRNKIHVPPEWAPHEATWLQWPKGSERRHEPVFAGIVAALSPTEQARLIVSDEKTEQSARAAISAAGGNLQNVQFFRIPTDWCWCRDNGPLFAFDSQGLHVVDFGFSGWKYTKPFSNDDKVPRLVASQLGLRVVSNPTVVEGGALEFNGAGTAIASKPCLRHRNKGATNERLEEVLREALGLQRIVWLENFEDGDMTRGHPDGIAWFVDSQTVVVGETMEVNDPARDVYEDAAARIRDAGFAVRRMPLPGRFCHVKKKVLANYLNWYIGNEVVLVGTFGQREWDDAALAFVTELSEEFWGGRRVVGIEITELWYDGGGIHCVTQQQPAQQQRFHVAQGK